MGLNAASVENRPLFSGYKAPQSTYCEAFSTDGIAREHWQPLIDTVEQLGKDELNRRLNQAQQKIEDDGVTYNLFGDSGEQERPWELDLLPFVISSQEWSRIEKGCVQRARLMDAILDDVYGAQSLLKQGILPAELVYGNHGFLYPCHSVPPPKGRYLSFYALDIYRDNQGAWRVFADYGRNPKGLGFALENRIVLSQVLPRVYRKNEVQRVASFFQNLRDELVASSPRHREDPRIAILSAGPASENYFEHAFLARYLTLTLVESGDLTVRDKRLFLKTLRTLEPVDVILRCIADADCDPLVFNGSGRMGVPGLYHAVRSGNIAVTNALGTCMVDTPALFPFLPKLCRHFFNEELALPSLDLLWCGEDSNLQYVRNHIDELCIMPAFHRQKTMPVFAGYGFDRETKKLLLARMNARPYRFAAFQPFTTSTAPSWTKTGIVAKHAFLRLFVAASQGSYTVLPAGLCRISTNMDALFAGSRTAAGSKDIWVLSEEPVGTVSLLPNLHRIGDIHRRSDLPSRVADNLLWLGRYLERLEGALRLFRSVVWRLDDETEMHQNREVEILIEMLTHQHLLLPYVRGLSPDEDVGAFARFIRNSIINAQDEGSIKDLIYHVHRTAAAVRDRLSWDAWSVLSRLEQACKTLRSRENVDWVDVEQCLSEQITSLSAFSGLFMESTTRGQGWRFMDMGRRLERGAFIVLLVQKSMIKQVEEEERILECLLEVLDSSMTYRARYRTSIQVAPALDLLLLDESNPRSLAFQLMTLSSHVEHLPRGYTRPFSTSEERLTLEMLTTARLADLEKLRSVSSVGVRNVLNRFLEEMEKNLEFFSQMVTQNYLSRIPTTQHFNTLFPEARK